MKVFVVTKGEYECSMSGIFSSVEKAKEFMETYPDDEYNDIDEWILDKNLDKGLCHFIICMKKDGKVKTHYKFLGGGGSPQPGFMSYNKEYIDGEYSKDEFNLAWCVQTHEKDEAIKVVNEKREKIIAQGIWGDEYKTIELFHPDRIGECGHTLHSNYWCMKCQKHYKKGEKNEKSK